MDEVAIYNRALSVSEIKSYYILQGGKNTIGSGAKFQVRAGAATGEVTELQANAYPLGVHPDTVYSSSLRSRHAVEEGTDA